MPSKLSNGCVRYLLESFCDYDSLLTGSRYHRITIPYAHAIKLKSHNKYVYVSGQVCFHSRRRLWMRKAIAKGFVREPNPCGISFVGSQFRIR
ncbi:unnamed protein product [Bursaphelenchus xylophilus]|uniref:(pine wood nematode) hypothetical protein n=1 Tax=Bursaphelenchus xylophilus TaxID=6326 RepID=A0A7I8WL87_BURXY|nr:unnamed protein product [Bursaphelenchus xylophilus]CAG9105955.1 unnamed protein product [Bursaphelenchus xylophilus]